MAIVSANELETGMILDQQLKTPEGIVVLEKGTVLTNMWVEFIKGWQLTSVAIADIRCPKTPDEIVKELVEKALTPTQAPKIQRTPKEEYVYLCQSAMAEMRSMFLAIRCAKTLSRVSLEQLVLKNIIPMINIPGSFIYLHIPDKRENYLYRHGVDVAVIAGLIGQWLGYSDEQIKELALAGLTADIGKSRVSFELLSKTELLEAEEYAIFKKHVENSCELLQSAGEVSNRILEGVYQHHERINGQGYPLGLVGDAISSYGKILAVADVYSALISERYHKRAVSPLRAVNIMLQDMSGDFDNRIVDKFFDRLRQFMVNENVVLTDGSKGQIIMFHPFPNMRPLSRLADGTIIDLAAQQEIDVARLDI